MTSTEQQRVPPPRPRPRTLDRRAPGPLPEVPHQSLGERLRRETRAAHLAAERAFDLDARLDSLEGYGNVLVVLDAFARASARVLDGVAGELPARLRDGPARRRERLEADLAWLGHEPAGERPAERFRDADHALGAWYVHEGAALGGLLIAAEVRRRLPEAAPATRFFAGEGRATAARWRDFQVALASWDPAAADRVLGGALATFTAFTARMRAPVP